MTGTYRADMDDVSQLDTRLLSDLLRRFPEIESVEITGPHSDENYKQHKDLLFNCKGKIVSVDVKGYKFSKRGDKDLNGNSIERLKQKHDYDVIWLERKNNAGMDGWIVPKEDGPDYIAFRHPKCFILVKPSNLLELWNEKIPNDTKHETNMPTGYYAPYTRKKYGHDDLTAKFKFDDLLQLAENGKAKIIQY